MFRVVRCSAATVFAIGALLVGCSQNDTNNPDADAGRSDAAADTRRTDVTSVNDTGSSCTGSDCDAGSDLDAVTTEDTGTEDDVQTPPDDTGTEDDVQTPPDDTGTQDDVQAPPDDTGTGDDVITVTDSGTPDDSGSSSGNGPTTVLPAFDSATDAHIRDLVALGQAMGNSHDVMAKIGDSITESASFLWDCGFGWGVLGDHPEVGPTIDYFRVHDLGGRNSLNRASICAVAGWTSGDALADSPSALEQEIDAIHPQWAIVMYGTNDIDRSDLPTYTANMNTILDTLESHGVVPVISTIPPRLDGEPATSLVPTFNETIRGLSHSRHIPLVDFWLALQPLPGNGISSDGIHPDTYDNGHACDFTADGLQHGYNVRSLTALQIVDRLRTNY